ncbi:MAG: glycosyltransferase family 39 protein, partial [Phycisphaerae bacterium]
MTYAVPVLFGLVVLAGAGMYSIHALLIIMLDGAWAVFILLAAAGLGYGLTRRLIPPTEPAAVRVILASVLGVGALALLVLGGGVLGWMSRRLWIAATVIPIVIGAVMLLRDQRASMSIARTAPAQTDGANWNWLWLAASPFLCAALIAACLPPGVLWRAEGNGYDVLEYHLAVPKEYLLHGRIEHLPHNIYAGFPFNAEMLYLLGMILRGSALEALYIAKLTNVLLAALAVAAVWCAARPFGRAAGVVAGVAIAACPALCYLSGIAYVENGLLAMTAAALACLIRLRLDARHALRWAALAGAFAGLACGFKYTAAPMAALPIVIGCAVAARGAGRKRIGCLSLGLLMTGLTFSPWLIKNAVATGNPVFPLARGVFPERDGVWSDDLAAHWREGHRPDPERRSALGRITALGSEIAAPGF